MLLRNSELAVVAGAPDDDREPCPAGPIRG